MPNQQSVFKPLHPHLLLLLILTLLLSGQPQPVNACFSQSHLYQPRESSNRQRSSHSFAFGEYQPKTSELAVQASGPEGAPVRQSRHLLRSRSDLLEFNGRRRSRYMTRRCKEKLEQLALLVRNQWNGHVRIRVHHAWMPKHDAYWDSQVGHRGLESLHFSGRAVDMSLLKLKPNLNYRDVTLGRLAQLAYYQAYFDYCKVLKDTVHCSVKSDDPMDSDWLACFPSKATVVKRHHGNSGNHNNSNNAVVAIDTLTPGDEILTLDELTGKQVFTRVLGYHHKLGDSEATYLKIQLANGHQLEVSPNHLVFSTSATSLKIRPTYAADLSIGDRLMTPQSSDGGWTGVVKISVRHRRGRYAPMTSAGHLLVNGVWVSSYAHTRHQAAAHVLFAPLRWLDFLCSSGGRFCNSMTSDAYDRDGVHWYSGWLHRAAQLMAPGSVLFPN
ncbi:hypothetical protein BOX15_Mlig003939g1 [Macrostomum lignano]|uniref:Hedgehog protein n=2 Tax=Macrostomum lignano TaxID=282301 RepID=A0A267GU65_9PLAT|nr:hypothetical protein BOX15_Mlig003939g2 [Macrostomum lignano]PAA88839.1 hypothetical protein BOX15_Mlig003939g1 [Macrostomum lignano]